MSVSIRHPELFGLCEQSLTLCFSVEDNQGPVDAPVRVRLGGEIRAETAGAGPRFVRIEGLEPDTEYSLALELENGDCAAPDRYFPNSTRTFAPPDARCVARFATLNDLHFGEPKFGGTLLENGDYGPEAAGFPEIRESEGDVPYWQFMNEDAIADINALGVDFSIIKGDIADRGRPDQFEIARQTFAQFKNPHHAFLGNHDHYAVNEGLNVDGYALLGQPRAPRSFVASGWRFVLIDTVEPGEHHGIFPEDRLAWLESELAAGRDDKLPTLIFMHHQPVPPEHRDRYPNSIGIRPEDSIPLLECIGTHPEVRGVLIGHTHRNRVRTYPQAGAIPFIEVQCTKDYPGGFAHYRLFEDGSFRQEVRRTSSPRALEHSTRCRDFFRGGYRDFALGSIQARSFSAARR